MSTSLTCTFAEGTIVIVDPIPPNMFNFAGYIKSEIASKTGHHRQTLCLLDKISGRVIEDGIPITATELNVVICPMPIHNIYDLYIKIRNWEGGFRMQLKFLQDGTERIFLDHARYSTDSSSDYWKRCDLHIVEVVDATVKTYRLQFQRGNENMTCEYIPSQEKFHPPRTIMMEGRLHKIDNFRVIDRGRAAFYHPNVPQVIGECKDF
jgi:hypothetical protein